MTDYPLSVKIVASLAIVLAYVIGGPIFSMMYAAGYLADRAHKPTYARGGA